MKVFDSREAGPQRSKRTVSLNHNKIPGVSIVSLPCWSEVSCHSCTGNQTDETPESACDQTGLLEVIYCISDGKHLSSTDLRRKHLFRPSINWFLELQLLHLLHQTGRGYLSPPPSVTVRLKITSPPRLKEHLSVDGSSQSIEFLHMAPAAPGSEGSEGGWFFFLCRCSDYFKCSCQAGFGDSAMAFQVLQGGFKLCDF